MVLFHRASNGSAESPVGRGNGSETQGSIKSPAAFGGYVWGMQSDQKCQSVARVVRSVSDEGSVKEE